MSDISSPLGEDKVSRGAKQGGSSHPLMISKIQIPRRRSDVLARPRLVNFIHSNLDQKIIMLSASAGYGKTSLLVDFANDTELPVCWYTLDAFDGDLRVFLDYFIAAIAHRYPAFGNQTRQFIRQIPNLSGNLYPVVATLVQEIYEAIPEYFILILDDHHTVENQEQINEFLDLFVHYVDENCHLVIASRTLPALPNLSLLVARQQAAGLSIDELRFTPAEIQELVLQNYGMTISFPQAEEVVRRTGGWITGLLLTVIPEWRKQRQPAFDSDQLNLNLYDYFDRQVLSQQPVDLRNFLQACSVLDELSSEVCDQVLGIENSESFISELQSRNLFVMVFDGDDQRLRFHDLFRDFLLTSLKKNDAARFRELNIMAAEFYASHGEWERALSRYLSVKEYERGAVILEEVADGMFESGRWESLARWIDALPQPVREARPELLVLLGKIYAEKGENERALALFGVLESKYTANEDTAGAAQVLAIKGEIYRNQGLYKEGIEFSGKALILADPDTRSGKSTLALARKNIGLCQTRLGDINIGRQSLLKALDLYEELGNGLNVGMINHDLGLSCEMDGDLIGSVKYYRAALEMWNRIGNLSAWANTLNGLGVIYTLQGKYDQAAGMVADAIAKARQAKDARIEAYALTSLADIKRDLCNFTDAQGAYTLALEIARRIHQSFLITYTLDGLGNTARLQGELQEARIQLDQALECANDHQSAYQIGLCHISLGILDYEANLLDSAGEHLGLAVQALETSGFLQLLSRAWLHRAQVAFLNRDLTSAFANLEKALDLSKRLGFNQYLVVDGRRLQTLLRSALENQVRKGSLERLWQRIREDSKRIPQSEKLKILPQKVPDLKIFAFSQPRVILDDQVVQWVVTKSRDLLYFLLQNPEGLTREQIGAQFWPDHSPEKLESAFRSTLYRLRRDLVRECVVFDNGLYKFNRSYPYWYDVEAFEQGIRRVEETVDEAEMVAGLEEVINLYRGNYLQGVYDDWCTLEREHLRVLVQSAFEKLARYCADHNQTARAVELLQRLIRDDPYRESAHRELMRCYYLLGDRASAIRQYKTCADLFGNELGLSLTPETQVLYQQILQ